VGQINWASLTRGVRIVGKPIAFADDDSCLLTSGVCKSFLETLVETIILYTLVSRRNANRIVTCINVYV
jgi:hypothetical protein